MRTKSSTPFLSFAMYLLNTNRFPKYSYDASSSILAIERMPSAVHEKVVSTVTDGFLSVRRSLPTDLRRRIDIVTKQNFREFEGEYDGSEKTPDTAVQITDTTGMVNIKFVLEVGFSETYDMLVQDARTWIQGNYNVVLVMIVKLEENPPYRCPIRNMTDEEFEQLEFDERKNINIQSFTLEGDYGPAMYKGFLWVGEISGYCELWERDKVSGLAKLTPVGRMVSYYSESLR